jgi:heme A synthase
VTSLVLDTGRRLFDARAFDLRSATVGLVAVLLLAALVGAAEVLRGLGGERARAVLANLTIAIAPLLVAFAVIVGTRFGHLL